MNIYLALVKLLKWSLVIACVCGLIFFGLGLVFYKGKFESRSVALNRTLTLASGNYVAFTGSRERLVQGQAEFLEKYRACKFPEHFNVEGREIDSYMPKWNRRPTIKDNVIYLHLGDALIYDAVSFKKVLSILKKPCAYLPPKDILEQRYEKTKHLLRSDLHVDYILLNARKDLQCDVKPRRREKIRASVYGVKKDVNYREELFAIEVQRED